MAYFGIYYLSSQLDVIFVLKEDALETIGNNTQFISAVILIEISLLIQLIIMRNKRSEILQAQIASGMIEESAANQSVFSVAGLSTLFNALT